MLTTSTRNDEPRNSDGVRSTTSPRGVLAFAGPPPEPINPIHSASCPMSYVMLNSVANTADQTPTVRVDGEMSLTISLPSAVGFAARGAQRLAFSSRAAPHPFNSFHLAPSSQATTRSDTLPRLW